MQPFVSIVIVTFNAAETLPACLGSIASQKYNSYEIVIIDGGSNDETIEVIKEHSSRISYWISEKDEGIYYAMNKGIKASKGEWIIFLGADDVFYKEEVLQEIFGKQPIDNEVEFLYGETTLKSKNKIYGGSRTYRQLIEKNISHQAIFYKRSLLSRFGGYNIAYRVLADYELNLRIFRDKAVVKKFVSVVVSLFNDKGTSNVVIDKNFFNDQLRYFLQMEKLNRNEGLLQKYFFFNGFAQIFQKKWTPGARDVIRSLQHGNRKLYYFLVAGKYLLSMLGIGKKIKCI